MRHIGLRDEGRAHARKWAIRHCKATSRNTTNKRTDNTPHGLVSETPPSEYKGPTSLLRKQQSPVRCSLGCAEDLLDLAAEAHERSDGPDEADRAVVERVVAERAGRDENVERVLRELVPDRGLLAVAR